MPPSTVIGRTSSAITAQKPTITRPASMLRRLMFCRASSARPAPMHWPTMVIMPRPTPMGAWLLTSSSVLVIAWAAMAVVPRMDTEDWIISLPNWNMPFSMPVGMPTAMMFRMRGNFGRILK